MTTPLDRPRLTCALAAALALWGCDPDAAPTPAPSPPSSRQSAYRYDGAAGTSDVTQELGDSGGESLHGTTDLAAPTRGSSRTLARESVQLDASGRLLQADIRIGAHGAEAHYTLDARRGTVHVERPGSASFDWRVPVDAPWLYSPALDGSGDLAMTPVSGWVALRAASAAAAPAAGGHVVRVLEPEQQRSYLVMLDQIAVATELGTTVALGDDAADADDRFVTELRLFRGAVTLTRVAAVALGV